MHTGFWWKKPEGKRPLARPKHGWEHNINMNLREMGFHKILRIASVGERLAASQEGLSPME
jgi:hypothetical protein